MNIGATQQGVLQAKRSSRTVFVFVALLASLCGARTAAGADASMTEYQVKALCLFNFAKYVAWPEDTFVATNSPIVVGIVGEDKLGENLKLAVKGKTINGREIMVKAAIGKEDWDKCQILFVSASEKKRMSDILGEVKPKPILTVGETDQFNEQGGIINFVKRDGKVRFEIDLNSARLAKLQISSRILSLADKVEGKP